MDTSSPLRPGPESGRGAGRDGTAKRRRSLAFRLTRAIAIAGGLVLAAAFAFVVAIDLGWQRERILSFAAEMAEQRLGVEISAGSAVGHLREGIELRNVVVGDPADPLVRIASLGIRWNAFSLLSREQWTAESVRIEGWEVRLHRSADGHWVLLEDVLSRLEETAAEPPVGEDDSPTSAPDLLIRRITLGEGDLVVRIDRPSPPTEALPTTASPSSPASPLQARLRGKGSVRMLQIGPDTPLEVLDARLTAHLQEIDSGIPDFDRAAAASLAVSVEGDRLQSLKIDLSAPELQASARARGRFDHFDALEIDIDASDLAPLGGWIQATRPIAGRLTAHAQLAGPLDALAGTVQLEGRDLVVESMSARELDLDVEGPITPTQLDPKAIQARFRMRARGLDAGSLRAGRWPAGKADLELEGEIDRGLVEIRRGEIALAGLALRGKGRARADRLEEVDVSFTLDEIAPWLAVYTPKDRKEITIEGGLRGEARLAGRYSSPHGHLELHSEGLIAMGRALGALELTAHREPNEPADILVALEAPDGSPFRAKARIDPEGERVDFSASARVAPWIAFFENAPRIDAELEAEGFVQRTAAGPRLAIELRGRDTVFEDHAVGSLDLSARTHADGVVEIARLDIDGELGSVSIPAPATLQIDDEEAWTLDETTIQIAAAGEEPGTLTLRATGSGTNVDGIDATLASLPLAIVNRFQPTAPALSGRFSGRVGWTRARVDDWLHGEIEWLDPAVADLKLDRISAGWKSTPSRIDLEMATLVAGTSPITIRGQIDVPAHDGDLAEILSLDRLDFQAQLEDWDISVLAYLFPKWMRRPTGLVSGSIRVDQEPSGPRVSGHATIRAGAFTVPLLRQRFSPVEGTLTLSGREISVDGLRVGEKGASATLVGSMVFPEQASPALDGSIRFEHLPLSRSSAVWIDLLGDVRLSGTVARPVVRGSLAIENGRIGVPAPDDPILREIRIASRSTNGALTEQVDTEQTFRDEADLDIAITMPEATRVRGQGANLFVLGDARILKPPREPLRILGEAQVVNGTYTFQGRRFQVRRGRVKLTGDERLDPVLDIEAQLPVSSIVAIVEVSGRLSSPIVRLRSDPPLPEQDVLSYLFFGRPAEGTVGANEAAFDAAAARLAAGVAERELHDLLGDAMPIDTIEIEADELGNTSALGFGKYVGPNLFFRYVHVLGDEPADRVGVEYRLNDTFSVGSSVSSLGDAGLNLILHHDF